MVFDLDRALEAMREEERIRCPYCGADQNETFCDGDTGLITYWGEDQHGGDNVQEYDCVSCEREFRVRENVRRTFDTAKLGEEFDA